MENEFLSMVEAELAHAREKHQGPIHTPHEAYGVIAEEVAEFFDEVRRQRIHRAAMLTELVQIAAMCYRAAEDLGLLQAAAPFALDLIQTDESVPLRGIFCIKPRSG